MSVLSVYLLAGAGWLVLASVLIIARVGQPREPLKGWDAAWSVLALAQIVATMIVAALR